MSCAQQNEEGLWVSPAGTNSITRAELRFNCQDQILNGEPYPPGPPWYIHLWGACSPTDCDWGEVGARRLDSGVIFAVYDHGFARVGVYVQVVAPGELWLFAATHYTDGSGREDREDELFLHREANALGTAATTSALEAFRKRTLSNGEVRSLMRASIPSSESAVSERSDKPRPMPTARARF